MAVNPIQFLVSASATATNGSKTVTLTGSVDASFVSSGTAVFVEGRHVVEAVSGTGVNPGDGTSTITLRDNWTQPTTTAKLVAFNTLEGLAEAIRSAREIVANVQAIGDLTGTGLVEKTGDNPDTYGTVTITAAGKALLDDASASAQRTTLGLGTAATANVTTSATDTTANRLLKVGDFGVGGGAIGIPGNNADALTTQGGIYGVTSTDISATPSFAADGVLVASGSVLIHSVYNGTNWGQLLFAHDSSDDAIYFRTNDGGTLTPWRELYHTGNTGSAVTYDVTTSATDTTAGRLLKVGDFGVGSFDPPNVTTNQDIKDKPCGFYDIAGVTLDNGNTFFGAALKLGRGAQGIGTILYSGAGGSIGNNSLTLYAQTTSGTTNDWGDIEELYHTGNLNVNEFGGVGAGDNVAVGKAINTTTAKFYLPISRIVLPTSITVTSTFSVYRDGVALIASGLTPTIDGATTSNKLLNLTVSGLTGLTAGEHLVLRTDTASSKITVNF